MFENFKVISLSHKAAPVRIRERMHLGETLCQTLPGRIQELFGIEELLLLSTCNRTEIYYRSDVDYSKHLMKLLCIEKGLDNPVSYFGYFKVVNDHQEAIRHLFEVSMGLESQVLGDLQISNQVKQAYRYAVEQKMAGPFLHRLLHTIFHTNKRVQQETSWRDGAASISYAAAELAQELGDIFTRPRILVVGMGEMGRDVALNLAGLPEGTLTLMNRTRAKAEAIAVELLAEVRDYEELPAAIQDSDVILSAVSADSPVITKSMLSSRKGMTQQYLIDLSVPRSIDPEVEHLPGILVYSIDELRTRTQETLQKRLASIPDVQAIITAEMKAFLEWNQELNISPTIHKLKEALEDIRKQEIARFLKNADSQEAELVDKVTRSMMNKIIKLPVLQLKAACKRGEEETLIGLLNELFNLEQSRTEKA